MTNPFNQNVHQTPLEAPTSSSRLLKDSRYPNVAYDAQEGLFWRLDKNGEVTRLVNLDEQHRVLCTSALTKKTTNRKGSILAWEIITGTSVPADSVVYFKNLNSQDLRGYNLSVVLRSEYSQIKDAVDNSSGFIRLIPHSTEVYSYRVRYKLKGLTTFTSFHDVTAAKMFQRDLFVESTVLLSKYLVSA